MGLDYSSAQFWFDVLQTLVMVFVAIYTYMANRSKVNKKAIEQMGERVNKVEIQIKHLPDHDDIGALHDKINGVNSTVSTISGQLNAVHHTLSLINEHLINGRQP